METPLNCQVINPLRGEMCLTSCKRNVHESNLTQMFISFAELVSSKRIKAEKEFFIGCPIPKIGLFLLSKLVSIPHGPKYSRDCPAAETNLHIVHAEAKLFGFLFTLSGP